MDRNEIEARLTAIITMAAYGGRQTGIAIATRSKRRSEEATEHADVSMKMVAKMAADLADELTR